MASRLIHRCRHALVVVALATLTAVSPAATAPAPAVTTAAPAPGPPAPEPAAPPVFDPAPARASLERLLPSVAWQFHLVAVEKPASGDYFSLSGTAGAIRVRGTSPATLLTGVGWYLERIAGVDIGWPGDSLGRSCRPRSPRSPAPSPAGRPFLTGTP